MLPLQFLPWLKPVVSLEGFYEKSKRFNETLNGGIVVKKHRKKKRSKNIYQRKKGKLKFD
jgi:hypothetical protein